jgi:TonB family protein
VTSTPPDPRALPAPSSSLAAAAAPSPMGIGSATSGAARGGEAGRADGGADERGARGGQGGPGGGGGLGAGAGVNQGSAVALAVPGDGAGVPPEYEGYFMLLRSRLHEAIRYPAVARRRSLTGQVVIEVRVTASGEIDRARIVVSSSHSVLDEAALEAARGLRVPFPPGLRPRTLSMRLPVNFVLQ